MTLRSESPLMVSQDDLDAAFAAAARFAAAEIGRPSPRKILPRVTADQFDACMARHMPRHGALLSEVGTLWQRMLQTWSASIVQPGFLAMITTSGNPYSMLADMLAATVNQHVARGDICEFATRVEERMLAWIGEFIGYPARDGI